MKLNAANLTSFEGSVGIPTYDRSAVTAGIVHFGVGGFHRAHQAMYLDRLLQQGLATDWGICGVGVLPGDRRMKDVMAEQDCLYTLALKHADGTWDTRVIGSIVEYLFAPDDLEVVIEKMASEAIRIVSLTITEGGYLLPAQDDPGSTFGLIVEALRRRRARGLAPFTIMSCDNIEGNGHVARDTIVAYAQRQDPELAQWISDNARFPSSMVDRITPVTTPEVTAEIADRFGVDDAWPVAGEPFTQWVLEDHFTLGRPPYEDAGVQVTEDVVPYELMKLRLLNASHQALCYFGYLSGYRLVHDVCQDPLWQRFLLSYMENEGSPTLQPVPGIDLADYRATLIERFSNPEIRDTVARLCAESSDRIPKWLLPVIRTNLDTGGPIELSTAVVASWARYAEGVDEQGEPIEVVDALKDTLVPLARDQRENPLAFVENRDVLGDLVDNERFTRQYTAVLDSLHTRGARATLESLV